jgi:hypothetical protein
MKKYFLVVLVFALIQTTSCTKDDDENITDTPPSAYTPKGYIPLKVGSYWVYRNYRIIDNGPDTILNGKDSVYISGTKTINGKEYFVYHHSMYNNSELYYRDSSGYLVNDKGIIIMSEVNFTDTIYSKNVYLDSVQNIILYHNATIMVRNQDSLVVPAGTFLQSIARKDDIKIYYGNPAPPNPFTQYSYYAKNVGLVMWEYRYQSSAEMFCYKLIRYHIPQ